MQPTATHNKLGIQDPLELAHAEELHSKRRAAELFDRRIWETFETGTFKGLSQIHYYLFQDIYKFAGKTQEMNLAKGSFRFASRLYLPEALAAIDRMPELTYDQVIEKYVEMNVAHPFREGNGRTTRIWLDLMLRRALGVVVDWSRVERCDHLLAMERSPVRGTEIKGLLADALTRDVADRQVLMKGIDASYRFEGYATYATAELSDTRHDPDDGPRGRLRQGTRRR